MCEFYHNKTFFLMQIQLMVCRMFKIMLVQLNLQIHFCSVWAAALQVAAGPCLSLAGRMFVPAACYQSSAVWVEVWICPLMNLVWGLCLELGSEEINWTYGTKKENEEHLQAPRTLRWPEFQAWNQHWSTSLDSSIACPPTTVP